MTCLEKGVGGKSSQREVGGWAEHFKCVGFFFAVPMHSNNEHCSYNNLAVNGEKKETEEERERDSLCQS